MKKLIIPFITAAMYLLGSANASAALDPVDPNEPGRIYINDFEIAPGETKEIEVFIDNPGYSICAFQFDLMLPEGLSIPKENDRYAFHTTSRTDKAYINTSAYNEYYSEDKVDFWADLGINIPTGWAYRYVFYYELYNDMPGNSGAVVTFTCEASNDFRGGTIYFGWGESVNNDEKKVVSHVPVPTTATVTTPKINMLTMENISVSRNTEFEVAVSMENDDPISAFQCDIVIPDGLTVADYDGEPDIMLSDRATRSHTLTPIYISDNTIRVVCYSTRSSNFTGNEGVLFTIPFNGTAKSGNYEVKLTNIELTEPSSARHKAPDVSCTVEVISCLAGDTDGDGRITITDVVYLTNYMMNHPADNFVPEAADANGDGVISISDVVFIVNLTLAQ